MGLLFVLNVACGLIALQLVNVPMFFCLRRLVAPTVLLYEFVVFRRFAELRVRQAVSFIVAGAIVAGWDTLSSDVTGYTLTLLNNVLSAAVSIKVGDIIIYPC